MNPPPVITVLGELHRKDGEVFSAGTQYEVLLVEDDLCEILPGERPPHRGGPCGRTICGVLLNPDDIEKLKMLA